MNSKIITSFVFLALIFSACYQKVKEPTLTKNLRVESFNDDWVFSNDSGFSDQVVIPHTPRIEPLVVNDQWQGKMQYSKVFRVDSIEYTNTFLHFEGVMHESKVFLNDVMVKKHNGGYLPFSVDLSEHLTDGENEIRLEVSNQDNIHIPPGKPLKELDFNFYGGVYRDVWLIRKNELYITDSFIEDSREAGWLIHFDDVSKERAVGNLRIQLRNELKSSRNAEIQVMLSNDAKKYSFKKNVIIEKSGSTIYNIPIEVESPDLWSTSSPALYNISIKIISKGKVYDEVDKRIGIRKIELTENGFFLNGEKQFIRGTNRHQEYPYVGYAISNNANFRDALKIKNAGFDFVRLSHYPQDESFLDACDELGLLVMNAIPGWQQYQDGEFVDHSFRDIRDMVRRDRNHPSVIFWEVSLNESAMTEDYMIEANKILKQELPFDDTYSAGWIDHPSYDLYIPARQHGKAPDYWNQHKKGKRNVFIAEYGDWEYYAHNAGFNQTAYANLSDEERNSRQLRAHGEKRLLQQAMNFQEAANSNRKGIGTIGHANWLMFDYNRGYADDLEASGISDIFRIPKFAYYLYKSQRPPNEVIDHTLVEQGPMVKIASYWTDNSPTTVRVFSNCDEVSLFLNDSLIGTEKPKINEFSSHLDHPPFEFNLSKFEAGELKAIGLLKGEEVAVDKVSTPAPPYSVRVKIDTLGALPEETNDLFFVYAEIVDEHGTIVPSADELITFKVSGTGELIGENPVRAEAGTASILLKGVPKKSNIYAFRSELAAIK